ncbi:pseudouridine synthase [Hymenobacter properus]|uniref:Pseudouridine synthase n=1 Tax=Hymenobacter properus TaxID=2791026 RepID=A0A931FKF0_9BACT|nr:pseudouridine synthase [Hymenobacter properus]MBF9142978.1 pseudouridine synthase [Hymenobacter properus]MBR7721785.1 pseudouridine synthase [Microvirga sp. SRT04]
MGKKHFSDNNNADRRGGRNAGGPGGFGNNAGRGNDRGGFGNERGNGRSGERPAYGSGRPASNGAFGRPAGGSGFGGKKFGEGGSRPYGSSYGGGERREGGSGFGGGKSFGAGFRPGNDRPFERRDDKPRVGKEQRSGTSYGRTAAPRPERSFGNDRDERRGPSAEARPIRDYQPKENWPGQPYRRDGEKAVPRGLPGERNRKFQKQNPFEQAEDRAPRTGGSFGRSTPREPENFDRNAERGEERGPNRPIRAARPFEANPPQPREERGERRDFGRERDEASDADYRADQAAFGRKFTPGAFGRRDGAPGTPRSTGERPGGYEKRSQERWTPAPGSFAERREQLKAQERSIRRSGTAYGASDKPRPARPVVQENRADKPRYGEKPGEAPDYKNLKHYEADKTRGNKRRREEDDFGADETRLNRYIANAGICSRREADALIAAGEIRVNGEVVTEMGYKVQPTDTVQYGKTNLNREKSVYVLLNKPKDFITTTEDPEGRRTVMDLVASASKERIFPVGRLDRNTTGLLLFTNDGEVAQKLSHPSHKNKKIYQVELNRPLTEEDLRKISEGLELEDGKAVVDDVAVVAGNAHFVGIEIHIGRNRIVRRIFEHLGYEVVALDRVQYAGLTKKDLPRGKWRFLSEQEVIRLKYFL